MAEAKKYGAEIVPVDSNIPPYSESAGLPDRARSGACCSPVRGAFFANPLRNWKK